MQYTVFHEKKNSPAVGGDVGEVDVMYIELSSRNRVPFQMITIYESDLREIQSYV